MTREESLRLLQELLAAYQGEWDGTEAHKRYYTQYVDAVTYIKNNL